MVSRAAHPAGNGPLNGGPQMVEVSRDGKRVYFTNSLYGAIDPQFYPDGVKGWMVKLNAKDGGGITLDEKFFIEWPKGHLPHQVRLQGGDASSDSYCTPEALAEVRRRRSGRPEALRHLWGTVYQFYPEKLQLKNRTWFFLPAPAFDPPCGSLPRSCAGFRDGCLSGFRSALSRLGCDLGERSPGKRRWVGILVWERSAQLIHEFC
jgi:hypothetical protein